MDVTQETESSNLQNVVSQGQGFENVQSKAAEFESEVRRLAFIRKVFLLMTGQLVLTCIIVAPLLLIESVRRPLIEDRSIFIAAIFIFWILYTCVICVRGVSTTWPYNYLMLSVLTVSLALVIACTCAALNFKDIFIGIGATAALCFSLGMLTTLSSFDFTMMNTVLTSLLFTLLVLIILCYLIPAKTIIWVVLCLGMILLIMYFLIDIQIIVRGKHRYVLSPDDHVAAATLLYVDVVYIFSFVAIMLLRKS